MSTFEEQQETGDVTHYKLGFSLDDDGFFRRACPECGLHFKNEVDAGDLNDLLSPAFKEIEEKYDIILSTNKDGQENVAPAKLGCPYCGHVDDPQNMQTDEFSRYFIRWAKRELVYPKIKDFFNELDRTFKQPSHSRSSGLFSIEICLEHDDVTIPIRPISGPELPDMVVVELLCCDEKIKIATGWLDKIYCPFCSKELTLL